MGLFEYDAPSGGSDQGAEQRILESFSEKDWARLLVHVDRLVFKAGDRLIQAGDVDRSLFILLDGDVGVFTSSNTDAAPIGSISSGSVIGEIAFFDGAPRSADVLATTDGTALRITREKFDHLSAWEPDLARTILMDLGGVLAARLRNTTQSLDQGTPA